MIVLPKSFSEVVPVIQAQVPSSGRHLALSGTSRPLTSSLLFPIPSEGHPSEGLGGGEAVLRPQWFVPSAA